MMYMENKYLAWSHSIVHLCLAKSIRANSESCEAELSVTISSIQTKEGSCIPLSLTFVAVVLMCGW